MEVGDGYEALFHSLVVDGLRVSANREVRVSRASATVKCRPRTSAPDDSPYPFTGNEGDADAIRLLLAVQKRIIEAYGPQPGDRAMGEFMSHDDLTAFTLLNHMETYLDNRAEYAKMADELRGYLVIA